MSKTILIMGESGSGKTTAMRNLDPKTTLYIDADKKGLSWKDWRKQYNTANKNYFKPDDMTQVRATLSRANQSANIKTIVIDTLNGLMLDNEMANVHEKGYGKWVDLAENVYSIISMANAMRDDLTIIFVGHSETITDDAGYTQTRLKTNGRKLEKIVLESKFSTVLLAKGSEGKYIFETQSKNSTAKSPMGAFENFEIENDITKAIEALKEY